MSVWVCRFSQALEYALPLPCHYVDGANRCKKDNGPCDAVEYAPVVRGKWIDTDESKTLLQCSCCGQKVNKLVPSLLEYYAPYCGKCGALMMEEKG